jgi:outer membrane protein assembly factor BamB
LQWRFATGGAVHSSPAIGTNGTIYVGSRDNRLYAINPDGTKQWEFRTDNDIVGSPAIGDDGTIYIGSYDNMLYAVLPHGQRLWRFNTGDDILNSPTIGGDGTIYIGSGTNFFAIDRDGNRKWEFTATSLFFSSAAIGSNGTVYVGCRDNRLYALNSSGTKEWEFKSRDDIHASPSVGVDETVYFGSFDNGFYAIYHPPHANTNGVIKWKAAAGNDIYSSAAIASDGTIYVGSYDRKLYAFNADGTTNWTFAAEDIIRSSPAIGRDGTVYVGSSDHNLYALKGSSPLAPRGWPMFRNGLDHLARPTTPVTNQTPTIDAIPNQSVVEGENLRLTVTATNRNSGQLTFDLQGAPMGATIDPTTGVFSWTPTEEQGPSTNDIVVRVISGDQQDRRTFTVTVQEANSPPILATIPNRVERTGTLVSFTATATDADFPSNVLMYSLASGAPTNATIDAMSGLFTWQTDQAGTNTITVQVMDNGSPALSDSKTFTIAVVDTLTAALASEASSLTLTWTAIPGRPCKVQFRDDLTQGDWQDIGESVQAASSTMSKSIPIDSAKQRFYRVVEGP